MSTADKYDVIIVGAGPAGLAAAYKLASQGVEVVVVERGDYPGSKNLSGAVFYTKVLEELIPSYWEEAPLERNITNYFTTMMAKDDYFNLEYKSKTLGQEPYNAFSVLRAKFDRWLAEKAEEQGAMIATGIKVDSLLKENGRVVGIKTGDEEMLADVVIAADGINSFLAQEAGLRGPIKLEHLAVGAKALIELPRETIEERFHLNGNEGAAYTILGEATQGAAGGAFFYTNLESLSIGVVLRLDALLKDKIRPMDALDNLLEHPMVSPLVKDGTMVEYGAHLTGEGGMDMVPKLFDHGLLLVGDAAGLTINNGLVIRGIDLAIASGIAAAEAIIEARAKADFSASSLSAYSRIFNNSFAMKDMKLYAKVPQFMESEQLYKKYAYWINDLFGRIYKHDLTPKEHLTKVAFKSIKENDISLLGLIKDGIKGGRAI
jgi:electron transfer flavoprotein-quinone oxidoreductase